MKHIFAVLLLVTAPMQSAFARDPAAAGEVSNTINCEQFLKEGDAWVIKGTATFDVDDVKGKQLSNVHLTPRMVMIGEADLFDVVQKKCGNK